MTKIAVFADLHYTSNDSDPYITHYLRHNNLDSVEGLNVFYEDLERFVNDPQIDKVVLLGDILDFTKNHGLNTLYQSLTNTLNISNQKRKEVEARLNKLEKVVDLIENEKVVYVAGNHEDHDKLSEFGISFVKEFEIDGVYFSHGDEYFKGLPYEGYTNPVQKLLRSDLQPTLKDLPKRSLKAVITYLDHLFVHKGLSTLKKIPYLQKKGFEILYDNYLKQNLDSKRLAVFGHIHYQGFIDGERPALFIGKYNDYGPTILDITSNKILATWMNEGSHIYHSFPKMKIPSIR